MDDRRLSKLYVDMYLGEGKDNPPMTVRVDRLEQAVEQMSENSKSTRSMMMTTMFTVVGLLLVALICFKMGWVRS